MRYEKIGSWIGILLARFRRSGGGGELTLPFDEFGPDIRRYMSESARMESYEKGVAAYFESENRWVLITTERTIGYIGDARKEISHEHLKEVDWLYSSRIYGPNKNGWETLRIVSITGEEVIIPVEPGKGMVSIWSLLYLLPRMINSRPIRGSQPTDRRDG